MGDLGEAVASGDRRKALVALADHLAAEIESGARCIKCGGSVSSPTAQLAKGLTEVLAALEGLRPPEEGSRLDEVAAARAARLAGTSNDPKGGGKRGQGGDRAR